jgi:hypothetical protein
MFAKTMLVAGLAASAVLGQTLLPEDDKVLELQGQPAIGTNITMYSGYVNITHTKK